MMRRSINAILGGTGLALLLAGCAGAPGGAEIPMTSANEKPQFSQIGGANVALAEFKTSAFPYRGAIPPSEDGKTPSKPFLDVNVDGRLGHTSARNGVLFEDQTYNDRHVLLAASPDFDPNAPGALVVFFHGNGATLTRDVVERQQTARQLAQSPLNAVLVAPQMALDALDSSAGNFWRPGAFAQFLEEAEQKLAELYPNASRAAFRRMPVVIVAYSGGYLPAAYSIAYGGAGDRVRGVVLLDALYGEPNKFANWVQNASPHAFFVSTYSKSSKSENLEMETRLRGEGLNVVDGMPDSLGPGVVAFVDAGDVKHEDFVNSAWTSDPLTDVLARMAR